MKSKKNKRLLITIILVLIIAIICTISYLYFCTDVLKTDKQLFFKYTSQIFKNENGLINNQLKDYYEKKTKTNYENEGEISFDIQAPGLEEKLELTNNMNITFSGKQDNSNLKSEKDISINYSDNVNFPLTYRKVDNIMGIYTKYIGKNFIAIKNDEKIEGTNISVPEIHISDIQFSEEEIQNLKITYFSNILNNIDKSKFSSKIEGEEKGYKLTLTGEELKNLLTQMLNSLKEDTNTINKISTYLEGINENIKFNIETIENLADNIEKYIEADNNIEMTVYEKNQKLTKISFVSAMYAVTISNEANEQEIMYNITIDSMQNPRTLEILLRCSGLNTSKVIENYEITLISKNEEMNDEEIDSEEIDDEEIVEEQSDVIKYKYIILNNVEFKDSVEIEDFTKKNSVILNDKDEEYVTKLMTAIPKRLEQVNKLHMEELEAPEGENPIIYVIPTTLFLKQISNQSQINENEINAFNEKFELYQSSNTKGATVKGLLTTIKNNNEDEENNQIEEINMDGEEYEVTEQNITLLKSNIEVEDEYKVEFEKDSDTGLIYRVVINKK